MGLILLSDVRNIYFDSASDGDQNANHFLQGNVRDHASVSLDLIRLAENS